MINRLGNLIPEVASCLPKIKINVVALPVYDTISVSIMFVPQQKH